MLTKQMLLLTEPFLQLLSPRLTLLKQLLEVRELQLPFCNLRPILPMCSGDLGIGGK